MEKITVIGHKTPDTDTVCAAIGYAWVLTKSGKEAQAYVTGELNRETKYVLDRFSVETPATKTSFKKGEQVILVDTNNPEEIIDGLEEAELLEIIDHHKLYGLKTSSPIKVKISTLGSTASLIYRRAEYEEVELDKNIAGILLSAILSDTLNFTSPTTTDTDREIAGKLAEIANVDTDELAENMFEAKSDLSGLGAKDILLTDSKVFEFGGKRARVSVLETTKPDNAKDMKDDIKGSIEEIKKDEHLDYLFFFIIDIINSHADLFVATNQEAQIAQKAFDKKFVGDFMPLPGVVSRKKQIVPQLEAAVQ